jgi:hypothetical protein
MAPRLILFSDWLMLKNLIYARFGLYLDASCQVWLHLAKLFQRRRFFNISQSEKRINLGAMFVGRMEPNGETL